MEIKKQIKRWLTGIYLDKEYIPVSVHPNFPTELHLENTIGTTLSKLNEGDYVYLGFKPLIIGLNNCNLPEIKISFRLAETSGSTNNPVLATLVLRKIQEVKLSTGTVFLYEGTDVSQVFLTGLHWLVHRLKNYFRSKPGNVKPSGSLYDQLIAAYCMPRSLSVVSVSENGKSNFFPIDLDGELKQGVYAIGLRSGGKSTAQVEHIKKIVLARVTPQSHPYVFSLGKNHLSELSPVKADENQKLSTKFKFPLPSFAAGYVELELLATTSHGIHQIHFFSINHKENLHQNHLGLLHRFCLQWYLSHNVSHPSIMNFKELM